MNTNADKISATACRWTARVLGILLVVVFAIFAIGEGMPNPFTQSLGVQMGFLALAIFMVGIFAGWRWELVGGIVSLAGWLMFVVMLLCLPRGLPAFVVVMALPGLFYLASVYLRCRNHQ